MIELDEKKRIIQEFVPGKQVTLAHVIASPVQQLYGKLGLLDAEGAIAALGEITGETVTEAVVSRIFSDFCVGK